MNTQLVATTALLATLGVISPIPAQGQSAPTETYQPGFWQPVARYNPNRLTQVRLVNRTGYTLLYDLTSDEAPSRRLPAGGTIVLSNIRPDSYVVVYTDDTSAQAGASVNYNITVSGNVVTNTIRRSSTAPGEQTLHLHGNGGIYVY